MKSIKNKHAIIFLFSLLVSYSCSVDNLEQTGTLGDSNFIIDENTANSVIDELYSSTRAVKLLPFIQRLTVSGIENKSVKDGYKEFFENNVTEINRNIQDYYQNCYYTINLANRFIRRINEVKSIPKSKKMAMIAEAKTHRAVANFALLRAFGQFYDSKSKYGIVLTEEPITSTSIQKRASVKDSYSLIISDLKYSVKHIKNRIEDEFPASYFTKTFVEAFLAKVYLSKGGQEAYAKAVIYSENVINNKNDNFELDPNYKNIFTSQWRSKEALYLPYQSQNQDSDESSKIIFYQLSVISPSDFLIKKANEQIPEKEGNANYSSGYDPRFSFSFSKENTDEQASNNKYKRKHGRSYFHLRMAEVYLIYAEALVRSGGDTQKAVDALNQIRNRAGLSLKNYSTFNKNEFLEDLRIEKLLELCAENGESWFDLVRYDQLGNLSAEDLKPTLSNKDKLIFPIPQKTINNNKGSVFQNPGY